MSCFFYFIVFVFSYGVKAQTTNGESARRPPLIVVQGETTEYYEPDEIWSLLCKAEGNPTPTYRWERNGQTFDLTREDNRVTLLPGEGTLVFTPPKIDDEAVYQCFAENTLGTAASHTILFKRAVMENFPQRAQPQVYTARWGDSLRIPCRTPICIPPPLVLWGAGGPGEHVATLDMDRRVFVDSDGALNFANVKKEDEQLMPQLNVHRTYYCIVYNHVMQQQHMGQPTQIKVIGAAPQEYDTSLMWHTPTTRTFLVGETIRLICVFAGNPVPEIDWTRTDGVELDMSRATVDAHGLVLLLRDAQREDTGMYQCRGKRRNSDVGVAFTVTIEARPQWTAQLESTSVSRGDDVEFYCDAWADPPPNRIWYINGIPLSTLPNSRWKADRSVLTLSNIQLDETAVIQCNMTNRHGFIFGEAYVNVLDEEPSLHVHPPKAVLVAEGQTTVFSYEIRGAPKPTITWKFLDIELTGGRYKANNKQLVIKNVQMPDQGRYLLEARNKHGSISASSYLTVIRATRIVFKPENLRIIEGMAGRFVCTATTDPSRHDELTISWLKDGQLIDWRKAMRLTRDSIDGSLVIVDSVPGDTGTYTCLVSNGVDSSEATAQLIVEGKPRAPLISQVLCSESMDNPYATVHWEQASDSNAPILEMVVRYTTEHVGDKWYRASNKSLELRAGSVFIPLTYGSTFKFQVLARNRNGWSPVSKVSGTTCTIPSRAPPHNPRNVRGWGDEPNNMIISWLPMPPIEHYGPGFHYNVRWKRKDTQFWGDWKEITDWRVHMYNVSTAATFQEFEIQVKAENQLPAAAPVETHIGYSGEAAPLSSIQGFQLDSGSVTDNSATFQWDPPDVSTGAMNGFFRGYRFEMWSVHSGQREFLRVHDVILYPDLEAKWAVTRNRPLYRVPGAIPYDANDYESQRKRRQAASNSSEPLTSYTLRGLPADKELIVRLCLLNLGYKSPPSDEIQLRTAEGASGPVSRMSVTVRASSSIMISWTPPNEPGGRIHGYRIKYRAVRGLDFEEEHTAHPLSINAHKRSYTILGLQSSTNYRITLFPLGLRGEGAPYFLEAETLPLRPPDAPSFNVFAVATTSFNLTWTPSSSGNPGSTFVVQYRLKGVALWQIGFESGWERSAFVDGLRPGEKYQVRVVAKSEGGEKTSDSQEVTLQGTSVLSVDVASSGWVFAVICVLLLVVALVVFMVFARRKRFCDKEHAHPSEREPMRPVPQKSQNSLRHSEFKNSRTSVLENQLAENRYLGVAPVEAHSVASQREPESSAPSSRSITSKDPTSPGNGSRDLNSLKSSMDSRQRLAPGTLTVDPRSVLPKASSSHLPRYMMSKSSTEIYGGTDGPPPEYQRYRQQEGEAPPVYRRRAEESNIEAPAYTQYTGSQDLHSSRGQHSTKDVGRGSGGPRYARHHPARAGFKDARYRGIPHDGQTTDLDSSSVGVRGASSTSSLHHMFDSVEPSDSSV